MVVVSVIFRINGLIKNAIFISDISKGKFALLFKNKKGAEVDILKHIKNIFDMISIFLTSLI